ncbi:site-specific integrase [Janthinobacterium sp. AD80]|uniref:site-specific integrase n=1 Tax=Janthinobacterium sp. AD80 TaxID=1528773 RepID=UPI000C829955|nr:site-specific integrase [Janthinobacterium sp. AD80]PMQ15843.1 Tyrosine recombinase XerC [Janthinobacterium sp. AD80]
MSAFSPQEQKHLKEVEHSEFLRAKIKLAQRKGFDVPLTDLVFQIRREDIGVDTIRLPASHTKTLKTRVIPIIPALRPWLKHFPLTITVDGLKSSWRRSRVKARMEHVNFHDLRHSCASIMLGLGVDLYTISKILGHSNVQTTQRYAHLQIDAQRAVLDKLSALVQKK